MRPSSGPIASPYLAAYDWQFMLPARPNLSMTRNISRFLILSSLAFACVTAIAPSFFAAQAQAPTSTEILPLSEVRPGMQGYAYTAIFAGDQVRKFDLEVIDIAQFPWARAKPSFSFSSKGQKSSIPAVVAGAVAALCISGNWQALFPLKLLDEGEIFTKEPASAA